MNKKEQYVGLEYIANIGGTIGVRNGYIKEVELSDTGAIISITSLLGDQYLADCVSVYYNQEDKCKISEYNRLKHEIPKYVYDMYDFFYKAKKIKIKEVNKYINFSEVLAYSLTDDGVNNLLRLTKHDVKVYVKEYGYMTFSSFVEKIDSGEIYV